MLQGPSRAIDLRNKMYSRFVGETKHVETHLLEGTPTPRWVTPRIHKFPAIYILHLYNIPSSGSEKSRVKTIPAKWAGGSAAMLEPQSTHCSFSGGKPPGSFSIFAFKLVKLFCKNKRWRDGIVRWLWMEGGMRGCHETRMNSEKSSGAIRVDVFNASVRLIPFPSLINLKPRGAGRSPIT